MLDAPGHLIPLLDEDPELGVALGGSRREAARERLVAPVLELPAGRWPDAARRNATLGLLVLDGVFAVALDAGDRTALELLGPGDVIQPWVMLDAEPVLPTSVGWRILQPARAAVLDARLAVTLGAYPEVTAALMHRLVLRARRLAFQLAANASPRIHERLELVLWHLATRWGRMTADGVRLSVPLTHADLALLVAAQRPSVTSALGLLREEGRLTAEPGHTWRLLGEPPAALTSLREQAGLAVAGAGFEPAKA